MSNYVKFNQNICIFKAVQPLPFLCIYKDLKLGAIYKGRPAKTRISRPPSPLRPDKTIESHSNNS